MTFALSPSYILLHIFSLSLSPSLLFQHLVIFQRSISQTSLYHSHRMASQTQSWRPQKPTIVLFLLCISFSSSYEEVVITSSKLDYPVVVEPADGEIKCGSCPCGETCGEQSPPPPPPLCEPPPPPPSPPPSPPPPPPPSPPPPKSSCPENCNPLPPPPPRFIYVPVPGVSQPKPYWIYYYSAATNRGVNLLVLALGGLSMAMVFW